MFACSLLKLCFSLLVHAPRDWKSKQLKALVFCKGKPWKRFPNLPVLVDKPLSELLKGIGGGKNL